MSDEHDDLPGAGGDEPLPVEAGAPAGEEPPPFQAGAAAGGDEPPPLEAPVAAAPRRVDTAAAPAQPLRVVVPPPRRRRPSRGRYRARRALALLGLVALGFGAWFAWSLWQPFGGSGSGAAFEITIPARESARQIGDLLASRGVIDSGFFFDLRVSLDGVGSKLRAGTFKVRRGMSYSAALQVLTAPPPKPTSAFVRVTIPEGFTREQIAVLAHHDGLSGSYIVSSRPHVAHFSPRAYGASVHVHTLEGFLFPATYYMTRGEPASRLVAEQLAAFRSNFNPLDFAHARAAHLSRYDVLIIASMIEREVVVPSDRRLVSAVIYNRLAAGMTLGIDSTLRYFLKDFTHPLTASELALNTPYNTRLYHGLPPTPISNPGLASMVAAADPAHVPYLYFVNKPYTCHRLAFATTAAEAQVEENAYAAARAKNGNREPVRCP